jgi:hypothetical protein
LVDTLNRPLAKVVQQRGKKPLLAVAFDTAAIDVSVYGFGEGDGKATTEGSLLDVGFVDFRDPRGAQGIGLLFTRPCGRIRD